jgi:hypothetical protein
VNLHDFFLYSAIAGGALFIVQLALSALGAGDADLDFGGHAEYGEITGHTSADTSFKLLSLQSLTAFFAMFGLVGLALHDESHVGPQLSVLGALLGGSFTTWLIARIFRAARGLEGSGTLNLQKAIGLTGTVYLGIAPGKPGKVTLTLTNRLLTLDAVSEEQTLETGSEVRVVRVLGDGSVSVVKA